MTALDLSAPPSVSECLAHLAETFTLEQLEAQALDSQGRAELIRQLDSPDWRDFVEDLARTWKHHDHAIVRGLSASSKSPLLMALAMGVEFKPFRSDKIVKYFKMSPWTVELSQTLREGHFHTDLSTAIQPPSVTVISCRIPDPTPGSGILRVARLADLLAELRQRDAQDTLKFLHAGTTELVDERAQGSWSGAMASKSQIRFHPETLRAAQRRGAVLSADLEAHLSLIAEASHAVSSPIELGPGDSLFVSNVRALHYRGACTVRYTEFPRQFEAREIHVLHLRGEPSWHE